MRLKIFAVIVALALSTIPALSVSQMLYPDAEHTGVSPDDPLAIAKMRRQVEHLEQQDGYFAVSLYRPLRHLGLLQLQAGQPAEALDVFSRMQNLVHRYHGVDSVLQFESLDYSIDALMRLGDPMQVGRRHEFRLMTAERALEPGDPDLIHARLKAADWFRNTANHKRALTLYEAAAADLPDQDAAITIRILRSMALTRYLADHCCAEESLEAAVALAEQAGYGPLERTLLERDYHDLARLISRMPEDAQPPGGEAPAYLGFGSVRAFHSFHERDKHILNAQKISFVEHAPEDLAPVGQPVAMCGTTLDSLVKQRSSIRLDVSLRIDPEGRPTEIAINGDAPARLKRYLKKSLKAGVYRPATDEDGSYTAGELSFEQTFFDENVSVGSVSPVSDWHHMMVAHACQLGSGVQI